MHFKITKKKKLEGINYIFQNVSDLVKKKWHLVMFSSCESVGPQNSKFKTGAPLPYKVLLRRNRSLKIFKKKKKKEKKNMVEPREYHGELGC